MMTAACSCHTRTTQDTHLRFPRSSFSSNRTVWKIFSVKPEYVMLAKHRFTIFFGVHYLWSHLFLQTQGLPLSLLTQRGSGETHTSQIHRNLIKCSHLCILMHFNWLGKSTFVLVGSTWPAILTIFAANLMLREVDGAFFFWNKSCSCINKYTDRWSAFSLTGSKFQCTTTSLKMLQTVCAQCHTTNAGGCTLRVNSSWESWRFCLLPVKPWSTAKIQSLLKTL